MTIEIMKLKNENERLGGKRQSVKFQGESNVGSTSIEWTSAR